MVAGVVAASFEVATPSLKEASYSGSALQQATFEVLTQERVHHRVDSRVCERQRVQKVFDFLTVNLVDADTCEIRNTL